MNYIVDNPFLEKIKRKELAVGCQLRSASLRIAEVIGFCGFDFIYIDTEHFTCDHETIENLVRTAQLSGVVPLVRLPDHDRGRIAQYLDVGVSGIILPHVDNADQATQAMDVGKYAPEGNRGFSGNARAADYGFVDRSRYTALANRNTLIIGMIESVAGLENLDAILATGIDALRIGPSDLSVSMGHDGSADHPDVQAAIDHIIQRCKVEKIPIGGAATTPEGVIAQYKRGFDFVHYSSDIVMLKTIWTRDLAKIRSLCEAGF